MMLAAKNLTLARGRVHILKQVSLTLRPGEMVGLLGANGAGKSPLQGAMSSDLTPDAGRVTLDGAPLSALSHREQARRRAVLPQKPGLTFDLGVRDVVAMGAYPFSEQSPAQVDALVDWALARADVTHLDERRYPQLSGGEQQRVQFARVLVQCDAGRAIAVGTPAKVLTPANLYSAYGIRAHVIAHPLQARKLLVLTA